MQQTADLQIFALRGLPEVAAGDDLVTLVLAAAERTCGIRTDDILVVAQKIVSKAEGRAVALDTIEPGEEANEVAQRCGKDPRLVELALRESSEVVRCVPGVLITRHRLGYVIANAGIDQSNLPESDSHALLLPQDPDASADALRAALANRTGADIGVVIADSFGRPWRVGTCGTAIGSAGLAPLIDERGMSDRDGRELKATLIGHADELAAAASIVTGQAAEGIPAVIIRGARRGAPHGPASLLARSVEQDLFR